MLIRAAVLFVVFLLASVLIARAQRLEPLPARQPFASFPRNFGEWYGRPDKALSERELEVLGANDYLMRTYFTGGGAAAALYIGYWESQRTGVAVHSPLNCLPGSGWEPLSGGRTAIEVPGRASKIEVNRFVIQKGLDRQLVLYWYQSHGRVVASEYWGKIYLVTDAVSLGRSDTAMVRIVAPIADSSPEAEARAERIAVTFVRQIFPTLDQFIPS